MDDVGKVYFATKSSEFDRRVCGPGNGKLMDDLYKEQADNLKDDPSALRDLQRIKALTKVMQARKCLSIVGTLLIVFSAFSFVGLSYSNIDVLSVSVFKMTGMGIHRQKLFLAGFFAVGSFMVIAAIGIKYIATRYIFGDYGIAPDLFGDDQ